MHEVKRVVVVVSCLIGCAEGPSIDGAVEPPADPVGDRDATGYGDSSFAAGVDATGPFFQALGSNDRTCASCHVQASGWSITPAEVRARFAASGGADPLFRTIDGANAPTADADDEASYSMLLRRAVIRVGLPVPEGADFELVSVDDPYGFASAAELSMYRRPLPATNLRFLSTVMWDGREPTLEHQALAAIEGHAEGAAPDTSTLVAIVDFERSISTAQRSDDAAGDLATDGATGGPDALAALTARTSAREPFALYTAWADDAGRRASIARGERIFNTRPIDIDRVGGLADQRGTCATCHDARGVGSHATPLLLDLGLTIPERRAPDQPLYTFRRTSDGATRATTDPGAALVTGHFVDLSRFKVPALRGLAMRPPYFHDGSAPDLAAVVAFYDRRFRLRLSPQERGDLVAFLSAL